MTTRTSPAPGSTRKRQCAAAPAPSSRPGSVSRAVTPPRARVRADAALARSTAERGCSRPGDANAALQPPKASHLPLNISREHSTDGSGSPRRATRLHGRRQRGTLDCTTSLGSDAGRLDGAGSAGRQDFPVGSCARRGLCFRVHGPGISGGVDRPGLGACASPAPRQGRPKTGWGSAEGATGRCTGWARAHARMAAEGT